MNMVSMVLMLLFAVVISTLGARLLPLKIPLPLLQILLGAGLASFGFQVPFDPHLFLLLFIPPLLFLDGWRIPKGAFFRDWKPILSLATGLVIFTVAGVGFFIHWLIPAIPIAVAFALAAILSPTDPVAVAAMTANTPLPTRAMHILEGESLLNDATGLVCFSFAVTAALTGTFSPAKASLSFLLVAGGGAAIGLIVTFLIGQLNRLLIKRTGEEPAIQILISLLVPFAVYLIAEHLHVSGILAAVVAGIAMHYDELFGRPLPATRMQRNAVWDTVQTALNGIIFVLLGAQLPGMWHNLPQVADAAGAVNTWQVLGYVFAITTALGVLRFVWVWISSRLIVYQAGLRGDKRVMPHTRLLAVMATAGVRGAITLAGILTLPLLMPDGSPFPARDLAIFIAMGVILLSLVIASIGIPLLLQQLTPQLPSASHGSSETKARIAATEAAIRHIESTILASKPDALEASLHGEAATRLLDFYRRRLGYNAHSSDQTVADNARRLAQIEQQLRITALTAERDELYRLRLAQHIDDDVHRQLVREIDLMESSLARAAPHT